MPTLYLSLDIETAIREASQGFAEKFEPLTICSYEVDCEDIGDLRDSSVQADLSIRDSDLGCPWMLQRDNGVTPATWAIAERLKLSGMAGILVPSFAVASPSSASNLVLWDWAGPRHQVHVNDSNGRLPVDQSSWPR